MNKLLPLLHGKRVGVVSNATGVIDAKGTLIADALLNHGIKVVKLFSPEHGYRGTSDAGALIKDGKDPVSGLPVISLYGKNKKPTAGQLRGLDVLVFDLQDVGARFYTYISTLHYVMEAAAECGIEVIVCDRPNPNDYVDGPVLNLKYRSFVGMHPIPVMHGLTVGELALMINGEKWLAGGRQCSLTVIPVQGWRHGDPYSLPVPPSPNLRSDQAIRCYPSLCFFEATVMSVGRGTDNPFTAVGYPDTRAGKKLFTPMPNVGASAPVYKGKVCYGQSYLHVGWEGLALKPLLHFNKTMKRLGKTLVNRPETFDLLAGSNLLRKQLQNGATEKQIRASWQADLERYRALRSKYLLYPIPTHP